MHFVTCSFARCRQASGVAPGLLAMHFSYIASPSFTQSARQTSGAGFGQAKVLWPNSAMRGPVCDIRGYDSTIPFWFVETFNAIDTGNPSLEAGEERHGMLAYNRIGNLTRPESLSHPALAAMGARYVVTTENLESTDLTLVHQADQVGVGEGMLRIVLVGKDHIGLDQHLHYPCFASFNALDAQLELS